MNENEDTDHMVSKCSQRHITWGVNIHSISLSIESMYSVKFLFSLCCIYLN